MSSGNYSSYYQCSVIDPLVTTHWHTNAKYKCKAIASYLLLIKWMSRKKFIFSWCQIQIDCNSKQQLISISISISPF